MPEADSVDVAALLQEALMYHRRADYAAAERIYRRILQTEPRHFDALHLLGVAARQQGNPALAIDMIRRAIGVDASQAAAYCNLGAALQDTGDSAAALLEYDRALAMRPDYALAHNNRGNALRNLGRFEAALMCYREALRFQKNFAEAWYNCGTVLHRLERFAEAISNYETALGIKPDYVDAWCNRGSALHMAGCFDAALASFDRALSLDSRHASALCNRGVTRQKLGCHEDAARDYQAAIALRPNYADAHLFLGNVQRLLTRRTEAIASYRRALACGADAETVDFSLAALGDMPQGVPQSAPASYVKTLFDDYAGHFDEHLVDVLQYQTPQRLLEALVKAGLPAHGACIDLGCGTGLCGVLLRPLVATLEGVDLSPKMIDKARQRAIYDNLVCAELCVLLSERENSVDLAVAADVLVYVGDLSMLMRAVYRALRPSGSFAFSVEEFDGASFALQPSNRFSHAEVYVRHSAQEAGMAVCYIERQPLRTDQGATVTGLIVVLKRDA